MKNFSILLFLIFTLTSYSEKELSFYKEIIDNPHALMGGNLDIYYPQVDSFTVKTIKCYIYNRNSRPEHEYIKVDTFFCNLDAIINYNTNGLISQFINLTSHGYGRDTISYYYNGRILVGESINSDYYKVYFYNSEQDLINSISFYNSMNELREFISREIQYKDNEIDVASSVYNDTLLSYIDNSRIIVKSDRFEKYQDRVILNDSNRINNSITYYKIMNNKLQIDSLKKNFRSDSWTNYYHEFYEYSYSYFKDGKIESQISKKDTLIYNEIGDLIYNARSNHKYCYEYDVRNNWILRKCFDERGLYDIVKREILYYDKTDNECLANRLDSQIIEKAKVLCNFIPMYASKKKEGIDKRNKDIKEGNYEKAISLKQGLNLSEFTPKYWSLISCDSSNLFPFTSEVIIAAYNTPIRTNNPNEFIRCLAIYERKDGLLYLREQYNNALDFYTENHTEAKEYSIEIRNNSINISYQYMRGEKHYSFEYDLSEKKWWLTFSESIGRTCCVASSHSYDYKLNQLNYNSFSISDDPVEKDIGGTFNVSKQISKRFLDNNSMDNNFIDTIKIEGYGTIYF